MFQVFRFRFAVLLALAGGCANAPEGWEAPETPVPLPEGLIDATDAQAVTDIVARRGTGYWRRDGMRDPLIEMETAGVPWQVEFYGCSSGADCDDLRFVARLVPAAGEPTATEIADWNVANRFGKATKDDEGRAVLELNTTMAGGVSRQNFEITIDWWLVALRSFSARFGP